MGNILFLDCARATLNSGSYTFPHNILVALTKANGVFVSNLGTIASSPAIVSVSSGTVSVSVNGTVYTVTASAPNVLAKGS